MEASGEPWKKPRCRKALFYPECIQSDFLSLHVQSNHSLVEQVPHHSMGQPGISSKEGCQGLLTDKSSDLIIDGVGGSDLRPRKPKLRSEVAD